MGRVLAFSGLSSLTIGFGTAPSIQGFFPAVSLDIAPFLALVALGRLESRLVRLVVQKLSLLQDPLIIGLLGFFLTCKGY